MQDKAMISLAGVTKVFYTDDLETHALDGIHLDVGKGEFLSISGPSGCGRQLWLEAAGQSYPARGTRTRDFVPGAGRDQPSPRRGRERCDVVD